MSAEWKETAKGEASPAQIVAGVKNLLDAPHLVEQGSVVRERYRLGSTFQAGLLWKL